MIDARVKVSVRVGRFSADLDDLEPDTSKIAQCNSSGYSDSIFTT